MMLCLDLWTTRWVEDWSDGQAQRIPVSKLYSTWMLLMSCVTLISAGQRIYLPLSVLLQCTKWLELLQNEKSSCTAMSEFRIF